MQKFSLRRRGSGEQIVTIPAPNQNPGPNPNPTLNPNPKPTPKPTPNSVPISGVNTMMNNYSKNRLEQMKLQKATETLKLEQPRAYYYQMIPNECSGNSKEIPVDANFVSYPKARRTSSETMAVPVMAVPKLSSFVEIPFSRDSCSDTDSGICTDNGSECQQSPKCSMTGSPSPTKMAYLPNGACRDLQKMPAGARGRPPAIAVLPTPSNFKIRTATCSLPLPQNTQSLCTRRGKQPLKVRFADEVSQEDYPKKVASISPMAPENSQNPSVKDNSNGHYYSMPPIVVPNSQKRHESPPPLPDYEMAIRRMREIGRHPRSQSLPRRPDQCQRQKQNPVETTHGLRMPPKVQNEDIKLRTFTLPRQVNAARASGENRLSNAKSLENLALGDMQSNGRAIIPSKSCENLKQATELKTFMPVSVSNPVSIKQNEYLVPDSRQHSSQSKHRPRFAHCMSSELQKIAGNAFHNQDSANAQKTLEIPRANTLLLPTRAAKPQSRIAALPISKLGTLVKQPNSQTVHVNSFPTTEAELARYHNDGEPLTTDRLVETRLLGLDHQGIQLVELRKRDDGPFGFYIATGSFKKKKGLYPLLSVGDQILDVDFKPVKGLCLEEVQQMMSSTDRVILRTLPAIMR